MSNFVYHEKQKIRRVRKAPNKKWMPQEEAAIAQFLKSNEQFEKPTAQLYYKRFLSEIPLQVEWQVLRAKVRNMRVCYERAKHWKISKRTEEIAEDQIEKEMLRICSYYKEFDRIFRSRYSDTRLFDSRRSDNSMSISVKYENNDSTSYEVSENLSMHSSESMNDPISTDRINVDSRVLGTVNPDTEVEEVKKQRLDQEYTFNEDELSFQREKFHFETEKVRKELEIREKQIESRERMKRMELEVKERIAMKRLEVKERIAIKDLELQEMLALKKLETGTSGSITHEEM